MIYRAIHITKYVYHHPVLKCLSEARITPRELPWQRVIETQIDVVPKPMVIERRKDYFGNEVASFAVFGPHERFVTTATSIVEVLPKSKPALPATGWEDVRGQLASPQSADTIDACEFVFDSPFVAAAPELADYARPTFAPGRPLADAVIELSHRINKEFKYKPRSTSIDIPLTEVLKNRRGVCQDFSHVMIGALRSLHLAARYVSGYLRSGATYQGAEASHAWVSVFIPEYGWLDLDPTNDVQPGEGHLTVAWGRDYGDVTPVNGITLGGTGQTVEVDVKVKPFPGPPEKP